MIHIDSRRGSAELEGAIRAYGVKTKIERMEFADFRFLTENGPEGIARVGIERKTVKDMLQSIESGRYSGHQLVGLVDSYDFNYLIVEGKYRADPDTLKLQFPNYSLRKWTNASWGSREWDCRALDGTLNTLRLKAGVHVIHTHEPQDTAHQIFALWSWFGKPWHKHGSHLRFHDKPFREPLGLEPPSFMRRVVKEFDHIGWERSKQVEKLFGNVVEAAKAPVSKWSLLDGITPKRAQELWKKLRGIE